MSSKESITPVSSVGDLITMSPRSPNNQSDSEDPTDVTGDFLTEAAFNNSYNVTILETPLNDDNIFMDASSLDYLVDCAESNHNNSLVDRGTENLFDDFDRLYSKKKQGNFDSIHMEPASDTTECDIGYETGSALSFFTDNHVTTPNHSLSVGSLPANNEKDKSTQKVPPVISKSNSFAVQSTSALARSVSPILTPTWVTTDRLTTIARSTPSLSPHHSYHNPQEIDRLQSFRIFPQQQDQEVLNLRQENRELKSTIEDLESQVKKLTDEKDNFSKNENKLIQQLDRKTLIYQQICNVMKDYEKTISHLIEEKYLLMEERDQTLNHLASMESSFKDLLAKYEKCKAVIMEYKDREKIFQDKISEHDIGIKKYEEVYNKLKQITSESLAKSNKTLDNINKNHDAELKKMNAVIKKHEITISSLQELIIQKTRDNEKLSNIWDEFIGGS